jgi:hypothetical protein
MDDGFVPDDFDIDFDPAEAECAAATVLRATLRRDGRLTMTGWMPGLAENGPAGVHFRSRERTGIAIADLRLVRDHSGQREVLVEFMAAGKAQHAAQAALCSWARHTGYRRVWLPNGPIEIEPPGPIATASVTCPTCLATWSDSTVAFWAQVERNGYFPMICPACGHTLPQWDVSDEA